MKKMKIDRKTEKPKNRKTLLLFLCFYVFMFLCDHFSFGVSYPLSFAQTTSKEEEALFVAKKALDDGFYDVSLGLLERFLKNYPDSKKSAEAHLLAGECYFHQNKFLDALNTFEKLLTQDSSKGIQDAVFYWIAEVHFKGNNFQKARDYYQKIIDSFPKSAYKAASIYSLGWCLFQEQEYARALEKFEIIETEFPKESFVQDAGLKVIECLYNLKEYARLKGKLKTYVKIYAKDSAKISYLDFYIAEADYYLDNLSEAAQEYTRVFMNTSDEKIKALCRLGAGWAYLKLKQYNEAELNFQQVQAHNLEKNNLDVLLLGKAALMSEKKSFTEVKNIYQELMNTTSDPAILIQAYVGKADALYNMSEYSEAIRIYREALTKVLVTTAQDTIDKLHYGLAWAYLKEGEFKGAIEEFRKIVKLSEDKIVKISALCQIGDAYQDSGDFRKAVETYDTILKDYPDSFYSDYVQYQLGLALLKISNYDGAIMAFKTLKLNFPNSKLLDHASYALGLAYFQREDYNASKEIFEKFQNDFKNSGLKSQAMYLLGTSLYNLGKFPEAIELFKNIMRTYAQDVELIQKCEYEIADCFYRMGNEKEAVNRFNMLRSKYPDSQLTPEIMWWLGEFYYRHDELLLARRYFSSLIQDFSKSNLVSDAYYALGSSFAEENRYEEAVNNFKKVISLGKSDLAGSAAIAIADIYLKQGKSDMALEIYKNGLAHYQNLAHLIYPKIGEVYYLMNDYDNAIYFYNKSLELVSVREMSGIQFRIAEVRQAQGRIQEAVDEYLKVPYLYSENNTLAVKALLRVASIYEDKEDFKEALKIYKKISLTNAEEAKYARERTDWIEAHDLKAR